jgi:hypothetical protein
VLLKEYLSRFFVYWRLIGPLLVLSVLFLRNGLTGGIASRAHA